MTPVRPRFYEVNPGDVVATLAADFERISGQTLAPASFENLLLQVVSLAELRLGVGIQQVGEQSLVDFAEGGQLDLLGQLVGAFRLEATAARCTLQFTLANPAPIAITVPANFVVIGGGFEFATVVGLEIEAGQIQGEVEAIAASPGPSANGIAIGLVNQPADALPSGIPFTVANLTATAGGAEVEGDEPYRDRIRLAPESFTVAGSRGSYRYHALSASPTITDVVIRSRDLSQPVDPDGPIPGEVWVYPLTRDGLPSDEVLDLVDATLSAEDVRPLTDWVTVKRPDAVDYSINVRVETAVGALPNVVRRLVVEVLGVVTGEWGQQLGPVIITSQLICAVQSVTGVLSVELVSPAANLELEPWQWARLGEVFVEVVDG